MTTLEIQTKLYELQRKQTEILKTLKPLTEEDRQAIRQRLKEWRKHPQVKDVRLNKNLISVEIVHFVSNENGTGLIVQKPTGYRMQYAETAGVLLGDLETHIKEEWIPSFPEMGRLYYKPRNFEDFCKREEAARLADNIAQEIDTLELLLERYSYAATFSIGSYPESGDGINPYYHR